MLDYNLSKRLKDAGFPQDGDGDMSCGCKEEAKAGKLVSTYDCGRERVYYPELSELIDACPKSFEDNDLGYQFQLCWEEEPGRWCAACEGVAGCRYLLYGSTPEEAVASLYLALNEKKHE